jgi:hypothetical protein
MTLNSKCAAGIVTGAIMLTSAAAYAAPTCAASGLSGAVVYVGGSSAAKPMLKNVSATLATAGIRLVYVSLGSCVGLTDITGANNTEKSSGVVWDETGTLSDAGVGAEITCDNSAGVGLDVAISDVFPTTCSNITLKGTQTDYHGSNQVFSFIVPTTSKHATISSEAAFVVYGFGGATQVVDTWNDITHIFMRDPTKSGSYAMTSSLIGLLPSKMKGTIPGAGKTPDILAAVYGDTSGTNKDKSIGVVSQDYADANRPGTNSTTPVKILAFQDKGSSCAYFPDSTDKTYDKINVRNGIYPFFGPLHLIADTTPTANVTTVLSYFTRTGLTAAQKKTMIDNEVAAFTIPQCAMKVSRTAEVTPALSITPYDSPEPCGCYFEYKATGKTSCTQCTDNGPCGSGQCRYGYCEAK